MSALSKVLQVPKIIEVIGSTLRFAHPTIKSNLTTYLAAPIAAAATGATVYDNNGFVDTNEVIIGSPGDSETEEVAVNGAVTRGQTVTVANTLKYGHEISAPFTRIYERAIKIYGAATDGGSGTLITSIDAISTPIADAFQIQWNQPYTEYTILSTDTAYAYYFAKFTDGTTDSSASAYVPATGLLYTKIEPLIQQALDITNTKLDEKRLTSPMFVNWANDCQNAVQQFVYQDPGTGRYIQKDWSFEVVVDETIALVEGQDGYALSGLTYASKYTNSDKAEFVVQIGVQRPMSKIAIKDFDIMRRGTAKTQMNGTGSIGATSIIVDSTANFSSTGSIKIGSQTLTYTAKTATTFTGIPASGSGSIGTLIADNTYVWQGANYGLPVQYVIFNGYIYLNIPPSSTYAGNTMKIRYLKNLTRITSVSDGTEIPFTNAFTQYFAAMIFFRLGQPDLGKVWMADFTKTVISNAIADYIPQLDEYTYYNYLDSVYGGNIDDSDNYIFDT